jgi:hypothetical protein
MDHDVTFLDCPAYLDKRGGFRCGLPAAVEYRFPIRSTDGVLDGAKIRCPRGHWFIGPVEDLLLARSPASIATAPVWWGSFR